MASTARGPVGAVSVTGTLMRRVEFRLLLSGGADHVGITQAAEQLPAGRTSCVLFHVRDRSFGMKMCSSIKQREESSAD